MFCAPGTTSGGASATTHPAPHHHHPSNHVSTASCPSAQQQPQNSGNNRRRPLPGASVAALLSASLSTSKSLSASGSFVASVNGTTRTISPRANATAPAAAAAVLPVLPAAATACVHTPSFHSSREDGAAITAAAAAGGAVGSHMPPTHSAATSLPVTHDGSNRPPSAVIGHMLPSVLPDAVRSVNAKDGNTSSAATTAVVARRSNASLASPTVAVVPSPPSTTSRTESGVPGDKVGEFVREAVNEADMPPGLLRFLQGQKRQGVITSPVTAVPPTSPVMPSPPPPHLVSNEPPQPAVPFLQPARQGSAAETVVVKRTPATMVLPALAPLPPTSGLHALQPPQLPLPPKAAGRLCMVNGGTSPALLPIDATQSHQSSEGSTTNACTDTTAGVTAAQSDAQGTLELTGSDPPRSPASTELECVAAMAGDVSRGSEGTGTQPPLRVPSSERSGASMRRSSHGGTGGDDANSTSPGRVTAVETSITRAMLQSVSSCAMDSASPRHLTPSPPPSAAAAESGSNGHGGGGGRRRGNNNNGGGCGVSGGDAAADSREASSRQHVFRRNLPLGQSSATSFLSSISTLVVPNMPAHKANPYNSSGLSVVLLQRAGAESGGGMGTGSDSCLRARGCAVESEDDEDERNGDSSIDGGVVGDGYSENLDDEVVSNASSSNAKSFLACPPPPETRARRGAPSPPLPPPLASPPARHNTPGVPMPPEAPTQTAAGVNGSTSTLAVSLAGSPPLSLMYPGTAMKRRAKLVTTRSSEGGSPVPVPLPQHQQQQHSPKRLTTFAQRRSLALSVNNPTPGNSVLQDSTGGFNFVDVSATTPPTPAGGLEPSLMAGVDWMGSFSPYASALSPSLTQTTTTTQGGSTLYGSSTTHSILGGNGASVMHPTVATALAERSVTRTGPFYGSPSQSLTSRHRRPVTATTQSTSATAAPSTSGGAVAPASIVLPSPPSTGMYGGRQRSPGHRVPLAQVQQPPPSSPQQQQQQQHQPQPQPQSQHPLMLHRSASFGASIASSSVGSTVPGLLIPGRGSVVAMNTSAVQRHRPPYSGLGTASNMSPLTDFQLSRSASSPPPNTSSMATSVVSIMRSPSTSAC